MFAGNSRYYDSLDVAKLSIQYRNLSAQSFELQILVCLGHYLSDLPALGFIGNLVLKSYGEWAQKKFEQDMDELENGE